MTQAGLTLWVKNYLTQIETGGDNPYQASFSTGGSGLSYGALQNDVAGNPQARSTFLQILNQTANITGLSIAQINVIMQLAATHGVSRNSFRPYINSGALPANVINLINEAISDSKSTVDTQDANQLSVVMGYVNGALNAAASNPNGAGTLSASNLDLTFVGELAEWGNRTSPPGLGSITINPSTDYYLSHTQTVSRTDYDTSYLSQQKQFLPTSAGGNGESFSNWTTRATNATTATITSLLGQGYYVPQLSDATGSDTTENNIAAAIIPQLGAAAGLSTTNLAQSVSTLELINGPFADASFTVGGLVHVPLYSFSVAPGVTQPLLPITTNENYVFDPLSKTVFVVGTSTNSSGTGGALIIDTPDAQGHYPTFMQGTYGSAYIDLTNSSPVVNITAPDGNVLFSYNIDPSVTFADGLQISLPSVPGLVLTDNLPANASDQQLTLNYLAQLGDTLTAAQLTQDNDTFLNPVGAPTVAQGAVRKTSDTSATDTFSSPNNGAIITGATSVTITNSQNQQVQVTPTNILATDGNITQDQITNIQQLSIGEMTLTAAQFNSFSWVFIDPNAVFPPTITVADGGTVSLLSSNVDPTIRVQALVATGWEGTTLIGNNYGGFGGQVLMASEFGNDTLIAGNGAGDMLAAGLGVDTLTGGTGGDNFYTAGLLGTVGTNNIFSIRGPSLGGLATGTVIQGNGTGNTLYAAGDISGATISDIQTLYAVGDVTLTAAQFNEFSAVTTGASTLTLTAATGGTYNLSSGQANFLNAIAASNSGTTLIGNNDPSATLKASALGNDTLQAGNGNFNVLDASFSGGNNTLTAGNVASDTLNVNNSSGNNILTVQDTNAPNPNPQQTINNTLEADNSTGNNSLTVGDEGNDLLSAVNSSGQNTLTTGAGSNEELNVSNSSGANILQVGNGSSNSLSAVGSSGNNKLTAGNGNSNTLDASGSSGDNTLIAGNGNNDSLIIDSGSGNNSLTVGDGNNDGVDVAGGSGNNIIKVGNGNGDFLTAAGATGLNTLIAGTGTDSLVGGAGYTTYQFGSSFAQDTITNFTPGSPSTPNGEIDFGSGVTYQNLWFTQSSNDLVVRLLGTNDTVTVSGWFGSNAGEQVQLFKTATGIQLANSAVSALLNAMATYQANNSSFNPATATQMPTNSTLQAAITQAWSSSISSTNVTVSAAMANQTALDAVSGGYTVADTAANVVDGLAFLESDAGHIASITLTDSSTPTLTLTAAQDSADSAVLGKIGSAYNLTVSSVLAANATSVAGQAHFVSEAISDTAADFVTYISSLETLAAAGEISSIAFTDSGTPTVTLTAAQQTADAAALAKITTPYNLVITGGTVTAAVAATATSAVAVSDTAANVLAYLSQLQTQAAAGRINSIVFTDSTTPTLPLTAAQLTADATVLGKITSAYNMSISGVTAANAVTVAGQAHVTSISVSDTGANVVANIAALETLATGTQLSSITLTDGTTPTLPLTASQYSADTAALGKIVSAYNLSVSGVAAANASTVGGNTHVTSLTVSDMGTNVVANIAALQTLATGSKLSSITLIDGSTPTLALTAAQYSADTAALGKIASAYNLSISGVTAANASTVAGAAHVTSVSVSDTAAHFLTSVASLQSLATGGKLSSVVLTDGSTPTISLTEAQMASDAAALGKITSAYNLTLTGGGTTTMPTGVAPQTLTLQSSTTPYTVTANSTPNLTIVDNGANGNDTINANAGDTVSVSGNGDNDNYINMSGGHVILQNNARADTYGNNNTITAGSNDSVGAYGTNNTVTLGDGSSVWLWLGTNAVNTINVTSSIGGSGVYDSDIGDTVNVSGNGVSGPLDSINIASSTINVASNANASVVGNANTILAGTNASVAVTGNSNTVTQSGGTIYMASGNTGDVINGGNSDRYGFASSFGQNTINNGGGTIANGSVVFDSGVTDQKLWFVKSGNDLLVDLLGTSGQIKIAGWYTATGNQVQSFTAGGLNLSSQIAQLVTAMATYQTAHPSFNPATATAMPTDTTLQNAITAAWTTSSPTNVTVAAAIANQSTLDATPGGYNVVDTAANVVGGLTFLQSDVAHIASIQLTDSSTPTLALTAAQNSADIAALNKITSAYNLSVSGVTAANATTIAAQAHVTLIMVSDTAANVVANIAALETLATGTQLSSITLTDGSTPTLALTAAQYAADTAALNKIGSAYNLSVSGVTAANAASVAGNTHVTSLTVSDTGANVVANIAALQTLATGAKLSSIALTDSGTPTLALTATQYSSDIAALGKIASSYNLSISGVAAANATSVAAQAHVTSLAISDTAANVLANIVALESLATGAQLSSITLTDGTTPTLALTALQDSADSAVLGKIVSAYNLTVSSVLAANAANVATQAHFVSEAISDTAADFVASISALETLAAANKITSIAFTDSGTPTVTLTAAQQTADAAALAKITSAYNLVITGGTVTAAVAATATSPVAVSDTSANVWSYLSQLQTQAVAGRITSIAFTDGSTPTLSLTAAQLTADATVLGTITSAYNLSISGVTAANASSVAGQAHVTSITVSDTAANVVANITALETLATGNKLSSITLTDSSAPTLSLAASQFTADSAALAKIVSPYNLALSGGGTVSMGSTIANVQSVTLQSASSAYNFTGNNIAGLVITDNSSTNDTITTGNGNSDAVYAGSGVDIITMGTGSEDTVVALSGLAVGSSVTMKGTTHDNTIFAVGDISGVTLSGIDDLTGFGGQAVKVNAVQLSGSGGIAIGGVAPGMTLQAATGGTYNFNVGQTGDSLQATVSTGTTLIGNNAASETLIASASGTDTLQAGNGDGDVLDARGSTGNDTLTMGNGNGDTLYGGGGNDTLIAGTGSDTFDGGTGYMAYKFGTVFGQDVVNNTFGGGTAAKGEIDFALGATDENLWFTRSGNDLVVRLLGTNETITVSGWFGSNAGAQVQTFNAGGLQLSNSAVAALVSAMATYQTNHSSFNPVTATSMPTDSALQSAIATAWPSSLNYSNVTVAYAQANQTALDAHSGGYTVADTAANVVSGLAFLQSDASHIGSITLTDGTTPTLALTATQYSADGTALGKITSAYNLAISGVLAANASSTASAAHVTSVSVSDTAAHFLTSVASLQSLATSGKLSSVVLTDGSTPTISLTEAQMASDAAALGKIASPYNLTLTGGGTTTMPTGVAPQTVTLQSSTTPYTVTANSAPNLTIVDTGANGGDVINGNAGDTVNVGGNGVNGNWDVINITGGTENVTSNANVYIAGNNNVINAGASGSIGLYGTGNTVNASSDEIWFGSGSANTATITGDGDNIYGNTGDHFTVGGNGQNAAIGDAVNITGSTVTVQNNSRVDTWGDNNTITAGTSDTIGVYGNNDTATVGSGSSIWMGDSTVTNDVINGGGNEQYNFGATFGHDTINNGGGSTANGSINFASGVTDEKLWFVKSGNDLLVDLLGTTDQIKIAGWYSAAGNQVASFNANSLKLDTQVAQLVTAMASYATAHTGFNPTTASAMPTDTTLQNAIAAAWHA